MMNEIATDDELDSLDQMNHLLICEQVLLHDCIPTLPQYMRRLRLVFPDMQVDNAEEVIKGA